MYAIIEACGKQYKVAEGDEIFFEKLDTEVGKKVKFDNVILVSNDNKVEIGNPYVKGATVEGKVISHGKGKKIIVFKYKPKKNYRRKQGHRQPYTKVEITSIKTAVAKIAETKESTIEVKATTKSKEATTKKEPVAKKETSAKKETTTKPATKKEATTKTEKVEA